MTPPRVSVVLCVYNQAAYVAEAIASILGQTLTDLELIIVDNGSTDSSPEVVHSFTDPRIRYVRNERNLGHAGSLNRGRALARGRYLAIMDSDDISLPERLARQADFLDAHPDVAMCGSWVETFGARTEVRRFPTEPAVLAVSLLLCCPFRRQVSCCGGTRCCRRDLIPVLDRLLTMPTGWRWPIARRSPTCRKCC